MKMFRRGFFSKEKQTNPPVSEDADALYGRAEMTGFCHVPIAESLKWANSKRIERVI